MSLVTLDVVSTLWFLRERGLIDAETIATRNVACREVSRRNSIFVVSIDEHDRYFVKVAGEDGGLEGEALAYSWLTRTRLSASIPTLLDYDQKRGVLTLEFLDDGRGLIEQAEIHGSNYSTQYARRAGTALARLHTLAPDSEVAAALERRSRVPFVLSFPRPPLDLFEASTTTPANIEVVRTVQKHDAFASAFATASDEWRNDAVIHGDLRLDNLMAVPSPGARRRTRVNIVDWEFVAFGDPLWDLATLIAHYLARWIVNMPLGPDLPLVESIERGRFTLEAIQRPIAALWLAYWATSELPNSCLGSEIDRRASQLVAAALVQIAYEHQQRSADVVGSAVALVQVALNLVSMPQTTVNEFLAITPIGAHHVSAN